MSETGIISQEYQNAADLFRDINRAVVILKKLHFKLSGASQITEQELLESRQLLASVLRQLVAKLGKETPPAEGEIEQPQIPPLFLKRLYQKNQGTLDWYVEDLEELRRVLDEDGPLTEEMIKRLDELCGQLDAETTSIYRKLWRK
jgi:hypothetical protein